MIPTTIILLPTLLLLTPLTVAEAVCHKPPVPAAQLPTLSDCHELIADISAISTLEDDEPITWSRFPSPSPGNRNLPYSFEHPSADNDCRVLVDTLKDETKEDAFSISDVAEKAKDVVNKCLEREAPTIGAEVVGPKRVMILLLLKKFKEPSGGLGEGWRRRKGNVTAMHAVFREGVEVLASTE